MSTKSSIRSALIAGIALFALSAPARADQVIADDLIVTGGAPMSTGSMCVGDDCVNGENFGFDTFRLKENNLRIHFDDTSTAPGDPANDWRIVANDSANGGQSHFSIVDATSGVTLLKLCAVNQPNCIDIFPSQSQALVQNVATNTTSITALNQGISTLRTDLTNLTSRVDANAKKIDENTVGVAIALALAGGNFLEPGENFAVSVGVGHFQGENATSISGIARLTNHISVSGGVGVGEETETVGGRGSVRIGW